MIAFPELRRDSTLDVFPAVGLGIIVGALLLPVSPFAGAIGLIPCGLWMLNSAWLGIGNWRLRYQWSRQYSRRLSYRQLRGVLAATPDRFVVHVRYFGGFDVTPLCPAAVVEDQSSGDLSAVYPASWRVPRMCKQFGVRLIQE